MPAREPQLTPEDVPNPDQLPTSTRLRGLRDSPSSGSLLAAALAGIVAASCLRENRGPLGVRP